MAKYPSESCQREHTLVEIFWGGIKKNSIQDILGGAVVKNPPCISGDVGSIPVRETKVSHAAEQLQPLLKPSSHN